MSEQDKEVMGRFFSMPLAEQQDVVQLVRFEIDQVPVDDRFNEAEPRYGPSFHLLSDSEIEEYKNFDVSPKRRKKLHEISVKRGRAMIEIFDRHALENSVDAKQAISSVLSKK